MIHLVTLDQPKPRVGDAAEFLTDGPRPVYNLGVGGDTGEKEDKNNKHVHFTHISGTETKGKINFCSLEAYELDEHVTQK